MYINMSCCLGLQALVEKSSNEDKKTYRYLIIEENKALLGKTSSSSEK